MGETIQVPFNFEPRPYQLPFLEAMDSGVKRAILMWARRSGKDKVCWNYMIKRAVEEVGTYFYFLPSYTQAKKVIWDNIDNSGFRMLDHIPAPLIKRKNDTELKIELINGSFIQLIAADTFSETSVGTNPRGVVFSEYSISTGKAWDLLRPILLVNKGWAVFNFTPRGVNHATRLLIRVKDNPEWFSETLTAKDAGYLTDEDILRDVS